MKRLLLLIICTTFFFSCKQDLLTKHLETGLVDYDRARPIGKNLIDDIELEKFAIFKNSSGNYSIILKLKGNIVKDELEKHMVALEATLNNENKLLRDYEAEHNKNSFNFKAELKEFNNHYYLINNIETKIKRFESLDIWLFLLENDVYKSAGGNRIQINNLGV